jgi:hypothetical protein
LNASTDGEYPYFMVSGTGKKLCDLTTRSNRSWILRYRIPAMIGAPPRSRTNLPAGRDNRDRNDRIDFDHAGCVVTGFMSASSWMVPDMIKFDGVRSCRPGPLGRAARRSRVAAKRAGVGLGGFSGNSSTPAVLRLLSTVRSARSTTSRAAGSAQRITHNEAAAHRRQRAPEVAVPPWWPAARCCLRGPVLGVMASVSSPTTCGPHPYP